MFSGDYVGEGVKKPSVIKWRELLKDSQDDERNRPRSRRTDENVESVRSLMHSGRSISVRARGVQLNLDKEAV